MSLESIFRIYAFNYIASDFSFSITKARYYYVDRVKKLKLKEIEGFRQEFNVGYNKSRLYNFGVTEGVQLMFTDNGSMIGISRGHS